MSTIRPGQKTVLVTGCTPGGIGHALCQQFQARGLHVIATARNPTVLAELAKEGMTCLQLDVTKEDSIKACREEVAQLTGGTLDILVNNAGLNYTVPATDLDMDEVRQTFETNVFGVMTMVKYFTTLLVPTKGLIINVSSMSAMVPYVFGSAYTATKGAVNSYSRTLRQELRPYGVRVMVASPGTVKTNITARPRTLPDDSLYKKIEDIYQWRLTFSKKTASMEPRDYAEDVVTNALKPEWPLWLRTWFGRPDWHYYGGMAGITYWGSTLGGEWLVDTIIFRMFKMKTFADMLRREEGESKKVK